MPRPHIEMTHWCYSYTGIGRLTKGRNFSLEIFLFYSRTLSKMTGSILWLSLLWGSWAGTFPQNFCGWPWWHVEVQVGCFFRMSTSWNLSGFIVIMIRHELLAWGTTDDDRSKGPLTLFHVMAAHCDHNPSLSAVFTSVVGSTLVANVPVRVCVPHWRGQEWCTLPESRLYTQISYNSSKESMSCFSPFILYSASTFKLYFYESFCMISLCRSYSYFNRNIFKFLNNSFP